VARDEEPATLRFDVFEDPNDNSGVYLYEAYVDMAGLEAHKLGEPFKAFIGGIMEECIDSDKYLIPKWTTAYSTSAE
jgi:quinol monooxygenase YgiN